MLSIMKYPIFLMVRDYDVRPSGDYVHLNTLATFNYIPSYAIGLLLGLAITKDVRIPEHLLPALWFALTNTLFGTVILVGLALSLPFATPPFLLNLTGVPVFEMMQLPDWALIMIGTTMRAWISALFAGLCYLGWHEKDLSARSDHIYLNFMRRMMSFNGSKIFAYFGKISFAAFLMHYVAIVHMWSISDSLPIMSALDLLMRVIYILFISVIGGLLVHLVFEAPLLILMKAGFAASSSRKGHEQQSKAE